MTSLTEVYDGPGRGVSPERLYAGTGLVVFGAILAVVAVLVATTDLFASLAVGIADWGMADHFAVVRVAGVLAGIGVPATLVGVFIVLPAGRRVRAAAAISASLCLLGVVLFWYAYPENWRYGSDQLTLEISAIYLLGLFTAVWCLFTAVVNFKTRNDPGGMLEMNVTRRNQTIVEVDDEDASSGGFGGIGFFGRTPDGEVETQTNVDGAEDVVGTDAEGNTKTNSDDGTILSFGDDPSETTQTADRTGPSRGMGSPSPTSDGGTAASDISSPFDAGPETTAESDGTDAEIVGSSSSTAGSGGAATGRGGMQNGQNAQNATNTTNTSADQSDDPADHYCGNCRHFEYIRSSSSGMVPYCARHESAMNDMDACDEWTPNRR